MEGGQQHLSPGENQTTSKLLQQFSLERIISEAEHIAPTLCQLLRQIATKEQPEGKDKVQKDHSLASIAWQVPNCLFHAN